MLAFQRTRAPADIPITTDASPEANAVADGGRDETQENAGSEKRLQIAASA
jgi:hypothetical protein